MDRSSPAAGEVKPLEAAPFIQNAVAAAKTMFFKEFLRARGALFGLLEGKSARIGEIAV